MASMLKAYIAACKKLVVLAIAVVSTNREMLQNLKSTYGNIQSFYLKISRLIKFLGCDKGKTAIF